ncbi:PAS domain-containing hybrid sensor histidine kinase/response regulator [Aquimarina sp. 2201CG14-23]|uniref:PAS domain-containing hybrid sensor histidine kinase/response regulator n=1 Tax=Aquimarina mycalae TaxID=3040073 RepID=UPI0024781C6D|nr:ATP-binding protein [Aquimarina sp. 2201CG14-23]MDH7448342.1 ATP-binding protein [Aquimarina sp. 2201CG14-23]
MILDWFKTILKKKKPVFPINQEEKDILCLIDFLWKEVDIPANAINLKNKIDSFNKLSLEKKIYSLPETYLHLEEHLIEKNIIRKYSKQKLRNKICTDYSFVLNYPNFELILQELKKQELTICRIFLSKVLEKSSELVGDFNDSGILKIKNHLENFNDQGVIDIIKERKKLLEFSSIIFSKIKNSLGENAIANIYLVVYKHHFQSYHLLDSFTSTLNVIPEEIFAKDLINFPSKQQMLKMLQKQLYSLEEVNERLTKEVIERKKVESDLKHSEHLKTRILETAMDGIILVDKNGIVLDWNKQAEIILRVRKEETIGKSIYSLVPYKLGQELESSFRSYIANGKGKLINKRVETSVPLRDGSIVYVELTIIAIKTKGDYLFNAFFRDITNRKIIDKEIREAKVFAEKSAQAKSIFLSNMSHEIRTPLNVILGLTGILQKSGFTNPKTDKKNLDGIQFSAENLLVLINDILDFSKIEAGKLTWQKIDFNIHELIKNVSRGFKIKADEKGLKYITNIDPKLPKFIVGDQFRLNQILTNLLGNAIKFTNEGEVSITITVEKRENDQLTVHFSVRDTGVGIAEDKLNTIFQSFYQIHKPGIHKIEGTGLGLSISKQLIELQGGILKTESTPNQGSNFEFSIQYGVSKLKSPKTIDTKTSKTKDINTLSGMSVLVVEDNKMNQFFIKQLFTNWDIKADIAENGKVALEKLDYLNYDLILMDMHMPVMDGPETTVQIRKSSNERIKNIPIVACSADVFPESKKVAIESGMDFYLTKPVSEKALEEILLGLKPTPTQNNTVFEKSSENVERIDDNNSEQLCNFSILNETFGNDTDIIKSVLQVFLEETPEDYKKLQTAIHNNNLKVAKEISHKLKSSYKTLGITKQVHILQEIEQFDKTNHHSNHLSELINILDMSYPKIISEIKYQIEYLTSLTS